MTDIGYVLRYTTIAYGSVYIPITTTNDCFRNFPVAVEWKQDLQ